jgi:hypothetical protein
MKNMIKYSICYYRIYLYGRICQEEELSEPFETNFCHKKTAITNQPSL